MNKHCCENQGRNDSGYGIAIDDCSEDEEGQFWCGNGEYSTQVEYCPFCGQKAPTPCPTCIVCKTVFTDDDDKMVFRNHHKLQFPDDQFITIKNVCPKCRQEAEPICKSYREWQSWLNLKAFH